MQTYFIVFEAFSHSLLNIDLKMEQKYCFQLSFLLLLVLSVESARKLPDFVKLCKRDDPNLSECWGETFKAVVSRLDNGIPEMNLRAINPIVVDSLGLSFGNGTSLSFNAKLSQLKLFGLPGLTLESCNIDLKNLTFKLKVHFKELKMESNYNAKGRILLVHFNSNGTFDGNFTDVTTSGMWQGHYVTKKGKQHVVFENSNIDVEIKNLHMYFDNLFPTNEELTINTNKVINDNVDSLYEEIKPLVEDTIKAIIIDSVNNVYSLFPLDMLYPN